MQKKYAPSFPISRFHSYAPRSPLGGTRPDFSGAGSERRLKEVLVERAAIPTPAVAPNRLNHRGAVNLLDRNAASV
jgi:hypothetical protein